MEQVQGRGTMTLVYFTDSELHVALDPHTARPIALGKVKGGKIIKGAIMARGMVSTAGKPEFDGEWLHVDMYDLFGIEGWLRNQHPTWGKGAIRSHLIRIVKSGPHGGDMFELMDAAVEGHWTDPIGELDWLAQRMRESAISGQTAAGLRRWDAQRNAIDLPDGKV